MSEEFKFTTDFDIKSATVTAQGKNDLFYLANVALTYAPKNVKNLNFILKGMDILGSNDTGLDTKAHNSEGQEIFLSGNTVPKGRTNRRIWIFVCL